MSSECGLAMSADVPRAHAIVYEFQRQLSDWQTQCAGDPQRELVRLYLLALEREENVAVAYDHSVLGPRLAAARVPADVREVMRETFADIWQDEAMHVVYVRRMLLDLGRPGVHARMLVQQLAGMLGGWSVAVRQHRDWSQAPVSRAAATLLVWAGQISGRVPHAVRGHLGRCSLRDFCLYNVHTETTAALCWRRLEELAAEMPELPSDRVVEFRRIADDEERHRLLFGVLAGAFAPDDALRRDVCAASLAVEVQRVRAPDAFTRPTSTIPQSIERSCAA
jgi:hypothetical protein